MILTVSYQKLLDRIPHLAWLMTERGRIIAVNQQWCEYFGRRSADANSPWLFAEILHEDERDDWLQSWQDASSLQAGLALKIKLQSTQGKWEWFKTELAPDLDRLGQLTWIGTAIRLGGEAALRHSKEFTRRVLESSQDCIKVLDLEGHLIYMNDGGQLLMEIDNFDTVANTKWVEFWQDNGAEYPVNAFATAKAGGVAKFEGYCHTFKGTPKCWDVVVTPILNVDGNVEQILSVARDITDRKQWELLNQTQTADLQRLNNSLILAQQQLQERNQELDRFVSIAAHDLKAPLRAIANLSEWIEEDLQAQIPGENPQLQLLRQRVQRMDALIDGLLRYSRAGREELAIETVDVAEILAETIDSLSPPASFEIKVVNLMPILDTKRLLLTQVFANLINNAIKHHHRVDGRIDISVEDLGDRDLFSIADDGPGIPNGESRERIFEIFQTLHPATDSTENTGIGLALVKKIVEGEGGEIWLDGECKLGCRFCFTWMKTPININAVGAGLC